MSQSDINYINEFLYKNNVRNNDLTIDFKPETFNNNTVYNRTKNFISPDNNSLFITGTTSTKGSKQNPTLRNIDIKDENILNRFSWSCQNQNPDRSCKPGDDSYLKTDEYLYSNLGTDILPKKNPSNLKNIFSNDFNSCPSRDSYHKSIILDLPSKEEEKPKWGTVRGFDVIGPRTFSDKYINLNHKTPFDIKNSGYNVQNSSENFVTNLNYTYENFEEKKDDTLPSYDKTNLEKEEDEKSLAYCSQTDINCKGKIINFSSHNNIYDGECGTKNLQGGILEKNVINPNLSKFVKYNIIGLNKENINESMINIRNKALFNTEIRNESNLNKIKNISQKNFINNTNQLRYEFNNDLETHTQKLQRNLLNR